MKEKEEGVERDWRVREKRPRVSFADRQTSRHISSKRERERERPILEGRRERLSQTLPFLEIRTNSFFLYALRVTIIFAWGNHGLILMSIVEL